MIAFTSSFICAFHLRFHHFCFLFIFLSLLNKLITTAKEFGFYVFLHSFLFIFFYNCFSIFSFFYVVAFSISSTSFTSACRALQIYSLLMFYLYFSYVFYFSRLWYSALNHPFTNESSHFLHKPIDDETYITQNFKSNEDMDQ